MVVLNTRAVTVGTVPMLLVTRQSLEGCLTCNPPPSPAQLSASDRVVQWRGKTWTIRAVEVNGEVHGHVVALGAGWAAVAVTYDIREVGGSRSTGYEKCFTCGDAPSVRYAEGNVSLLLHHGPRREATTRIAVTKFGFA